MMNQSLNKSRIWPCTSFQSVPVGFCGLFKVLIFSSPMDLSVLLRACMLGAIIGPWWRVSMTVKLNWVERGQVWDPEAPSCRQKPKPPWILSPISSQLCVICLDIAAGAPSYYLKIPMLVLEIWEGPWCRPPAFPEIAAWGRRGGGGSTGPVLVFATTFHFSSLM